MHGTTPQKDKTVYGMYSYCMSQYRCAYTILMTATVCEYYY